MTNRLNESKECCKKDCLGPILRMSECNAETDEKCAHSPIHYYPLTRPIDNLECWQIAVMVKYY